MGTDAKIKIFDYNKYQSSMVPMVLDYLKKGQVPDGGVDEDGETPTCTSIPPVDLAKYCHFLSNDLGWEGEKCSISESENRDESDNELGPWDGWSDRLCISSDCPEQTKCLFHKSGRPDLAEEVFHQFFNYLLTGAAIGEGQFVGRNYSALCYSELLLRLKKRSKKLISRLLRHLQNRGRVVGCHWFYCGTEGIHGWLTPEETTDLYNELSALNLPTYEPTFEAMESFRQDSSYEPPEGFSFKQLSLSYVRTVCSIAMKEGKGVIWEND